MQQKEKILLGAHTSTAGGLHNALLEGQKIGATTVQLFTSNQRQWLPRRNIDAHALALWREALASTHLTKIMSHDSYLINLGAPDEGMLAKSRRAFGEEINRCQTLHISYLNFHPGAAKDGGIQECLDRIVTSLLEVKELLQGENAPRLLLETTAGQGSSVGCRFEQLAYIIDSVKDQLPIGVCIDTCHIFAAGYDISSANGLDATLGEFDRIVGLKHLYAFHLNDSLKGLGSRVDRHLPLGKGLIGLDCFRLLMNDPRTRHLPKYLETPGGVDLWAKEIPLLYSLIL